MRIVLLCLALAAIGCTHRHRVSTLPADLDGDAVEVDRTDGRSEEMHVRDGALYTPTGSTLRLGAAHRVTYVSHGKGALEGLGLGALVGGGIGVIFGLASGDDPPCGDEAFFCLRFTAGEKAVIGGIYVGAIGGLVGVIVGAVHGSRVIYEIDGATITIDGPPGSIAGLTTTF